MTLLPLNRVVRDAPGWYAGDFHCHTHHSDGELSPQELLATARAEGLDFFVITDHNTTAAYAGFGDPQDFLVIPGLEVTFDHGHFNVFGIEHGLPWADPFCPGPTEIRLRETQYNLSHLIHEAAAAGLITSINHPLLPPWVWADPYTALRDVHCLEIWNDPSWPDNRIANPATVELWTAWLNAGYRIVALGGSDFHRPKPKSGADRPPERLGTPRTFVYARQLSGRAILDGVRGGHVYMSMGPRVSFDGIHNNQGVLMGQDLGAVDGELHLRATVQAGYFGQARILCNGGVVAETNLNGGEAALDLRVHLHAQEAAWFRLDVHAYRADSPDTLAWAVTNPIYTGPTPTPTALVYGDFVEMPVIHEPTDRLQWPQLKTPSSTLE